MSVLFCGYYGQRNAGDDAFNVVSLWGARNFWGVEDCALLSYTAPTLPFPARTVLPAGGGRFKGHAYLCAIVESAAIGDVVYAGGTTFHSRPRPRDPSFYHLLLRRARLCRLAAIGVSIGPFSKPAEREGVRRFLRGFSFIGVRDAASRQRAAAMGLGERVMETFDLAALLPLIAVRPAPSPRLRIGVSLCRYASLLGKDETAEVARMERMHGSLLLLARRLPQAEFRFYAFNSHPFLGDVELSRRMEARLREETGALCSVFAYDGDPIALWADVSTCRALIGTRLHSAIFAYSAGLPFLLAEYHPKCSDFLETIGYSPRFRAPACFLRPEDGAAAVERLLEMRDVRALARLSPQAAAARALLNFTAAPLGAGRLSSEGPAAPARASRGRWAWPRRAKRRPGALRRDPVRRYTAWKPRRRPPASA